ncbi:diguanylate cyclase domain protein [Anoxybacillus sp. B7M1]|uniref:diguanylate cyclase n=1 Tax=unclassified Anoxybacillus TaxID=2639704 RepID=UPI0005CD7FD5|nr:MULTISPECIES: diguanylate cyclase [unclassified Anoxybacillus]ANB56381.1 diguanylate cyclase domain protein [Anoxybacillus sp. B2M1]ANB63668.1 diguanylate cyclase domain protein [Anoxybacillus sp. B7M1]QHC03940.1 diguanylate cyclase [Anoxybacillus sp. PDR2]
MFSNKYFHQKNLVKLYVAIIYGAGLFVCLWKSSFFTQSLEDWVLIYMLSSSVLLLSYFSIHLPPKDNSFSMDSAIYLASMFLYGISLTLNVLLFSIIIELLYKRRRVASWKHLFNFSMYSLMMVGAYYTFLLFGGRIGEINTNNLFPYMISLVVYFSLNIMFMFLFFFLSGQIFKGTFNLGVLGEACISYFVTLLLSLVLAILLEEQKYFGLFLFTVLVTLLSFVFRKFLQLYQSVAERANRDDLTGLYNHGFFKETLKEHFADVKKLPQSFCLALLDLDDFKKYNDCNGHLRGDELLKFFGDLLQAETKEKNYIVARYGGEEFAILMPNTTKEAAFLFLDRLRKKVNDTYFIGVEYVPYRCLSFSCGIAEYEKGMYDSGELIHKADQAMYYAKAQGKNNVQIYDEENICWSQIEFKEDLEDMEQLLRIFLSKDVYTYRHSKRVFTYALEFSERLDLTDHEKQTLILGALIHDIGKIEVPRDILNKKGKLEPHEWEIIQKHVIWGKEILASNRRFEDVLPLVELHHERYDGKGYPYGLKGEEIPKLARILCIIDSFDAMTTERPYQPTKTFEEAVAELRACAGTQFDPYYAQQFIQFIETQYMPRLERTNR